MSIRFINDENHVLNMVGELSNLPPIKDIQFEYNDGYLYGGVRRNRGSSCQIELENGYDVAYFSEAGFGQSEKDAEMKCLLQLSEINKYLEFVKVN